MEVPAVEEDPGTGAVSIVPYHDVSAEIEISDSVVASCYHGSDSGISLLGKLRKILCKEGMI